MVLQIDTKDWRTVKLKVNFGSNVAGDTCGLPKKVATGLVLDGYAEPVGWEPKGNGKDHEVVVVQAAEIKPAKRKRSS